MSRKIKRILLFVGLLAILLAGWFLRTRYLATDEVYVLPNNFTGAVIILMDYPKGKPEKYDQEGNRVYEIPVNGILKTKFSHEEGYRDVTYIRQNGDTLRYLWPPDKAWEYTAKIDNIYKDSVYVYLESYADDVWFLGLSSIYNSKMRIFRGWKKPKTSKPSSSGCLPRPRNNC
ncbi:MAG: hypothetical protein U5L96_10990 [Owenweeksia sp.]|nr:hypothetical protein [Owenweeksia sp.]